MISELRGDFENDIYIVLHELNRVYLMWLEN